jgi:hypothetical protein
MTRQRALTSAFVLTTIVALALTAFGTAAGVFAWSRDEGAPSNTAFEATPGNGDAAPAATVAPGMVTDFVYVDQSAPRIEGEYEEYGDDDDHHDGEWDGDDEHDDREHHDDDDDEHHDDDDGHDDDD